MFIIKNIPLPSCSHSKSNDEPGVEEMHVCCFINVLASRI